MAVDSEDDNVVVRMIKSAAALRSETLDLDNKRIYEIPKEILNLQDLQSLHLQSNYISELPEEFFETLTNLKWLDLRNNQLTCLPTSIGKHRTLRSLLLEGNSLAHLPCELGMARSLCGLSLSGNPLEFPPSHIIQKGTQEILKYLREIRDKSLWTADEQIPHSVLQSDEESEDSSYTSSVEFSETNHMTAGQSLASESSATIQDKTHKITSFKLPPIVRKAKTVCRSYSDGEIVMGRTVKQFEPTRHVSLSWKRYGTSRKASEQELRRNNKTPMKETNVENPSKRGRKRPEKKIVKLINLPSLAMSEPLNNTSSSSDEHSSLVDHTGHEPISCIEHTQHALISRVTDNENDENIKDSIIYNNTPVRIAPQSAGGNALIDLVVGDFVAIKVPEIHLIKGQPCIAKVVAEVDERNEVLVHYYTGTYNGTFRAMMSRSSPYLRKVAIQNILCKFEMQSDNTLSPRTAVRIRQMIEGGDC